LSQEANRERLSKKHNYNNTLPFHANSSFLFKQNEINGVTGLLPDFFCGEKMSLKKLYVNVSFQRKDGWWRIEYICPFTFK
tara:strand:+ start:609 stop:851 length:243 start_codon:yes stop_codon:yes gene_type:complete